MIGTIWDNLPKKTIVSVIFAASAIVWGPWGGKAVDTVSPVTQSQAQAFKDEGNSVLITASSMWSPCRVAPQIVPYAPDNNIIAESVGLEPANYFLVSPHESGTAAVDRIKENTPDDVWDRSLFYAIDYEVPEDCMPMYAVSYGTITAAVNRLMELGKCVIWTDGQCYVVIYTNYGNWVGNLGNPPAPANTLLWNAYWDDDCTDMDFTHLPFGTWTPEQVIAEQCNGGHYVAGVNVDQNVIRQFTREVPSPTPPPTPTPVIKPPACSCCETYTREQMLWALTAAGFIEGMKSFGGSPYELHPFDKAILACLSK